MTGKARAVVGKATPHVTGSHDGPVPFVMKNPKKNWEADAACLAGDPDHAFPKHGGSKEAGRRARTMCPPCPVIAECLSFAFETDQRYGIWGGTTERKRNAMWKAARKP